VRNLVDRQAATNARPPAAWVAVLVWCAVCGWFAFIRDARVPIVSIADFGFHELGHLVMYVIPINQILTAAMGSIMQCAVPLGLSVYFWFARSDRVGAVACLAWTATNFHDASVYIADAPYERLELIGGEHDWAFIFDKLDRMEQASSVAALTRNAGLLLLLAAIALGCLGLLGVFSTRAADPAEARASRSDDLFPTL
jgi:hypothetical protein